MSARDATNEESPPSPFVYDTKLEEQAIGILLHEADRAHECIAEFDARMFWDIRYKAAYKAIAALTKELRIPTVDAISTKLVETEKDFDLEVARKLLRDAMSVGHPRRSQEVIARLRDLAEKRSLQIIASNILELACDPSYTASELVTNSVERIKSVHGNSNTIAAKPLVHFAPLPDDDQSVLLGPGRWLTRGSGNFLVAYTGIGKSTLCVTASMAWAVGKPCLGIQPNGPLKSVIIQSEDDPGDVASMMQGFYDVLNPSPEQIKQLEKNVLVVTENSCTGIRFLNTIVRPTLQQHQPDLLWVNPISAYFGGDLKDPALTAEFFRNSLNPMLTEFGAGFWGIHHATKPNKDRNEWQGGELAYMGAGNADLANWSRETLVLREVGDGVFEMIATKRWRKLGWKDADGNPSRLQQIAYGLNGRQYWRLADESDLSRAGARRYTEDGCVELVPDGGMDKSELVKLAAERFKLSDRTARSNLDDLTANRWLTVGGIRIKAARLKERDRDRKEVYPDKPPGRKVVWITRVDDFQTEIAT